MMRTILAFLLIAPQLAAHEAPAGWRYEPYCCNGNAHTGDCQPIQSRSIKVVRGGYQVTIQPGDHRLATKPHTFFVPTEQARRSQDEDYHLCLYPNEDTLRCFYAPDMSY